MVVDNLTILEPAKEITQKEYVVQQNQRHCLRTVSILFTVKHYFTGNIFFYQRTDLFIVTFVIICSAYRDFYTVCFPLHS